MGLFTIGFFITLYYTLEKGYSVIKVLINKNPLHH